MRLIIDELLLPQAESLGLVLTAKGIAHDVRMSESGYSIWVADADQLHALRVLDAYLEDNKERPQPEPEQPLVRTLSALWIIIPFLAWYVASSMTFSQNFLVQNFGAAAAHIVQGEWFRAVTALTLHSGPSHFIGNAIGLAIFGTAVCSLVGVGCGWLLILLSGVTGNLINAYVHSTAHVSIGASTAVFGAVGILASMQFFRRWRGRRQRARAWLSLAAGVALLGFLSAGERTDILAHLFGFGVGLILGYAYSLLRKQPFTAPVQYVSAGLALGLLALAWTLATQVL